LTRVIEARQGNQQVITSVEPPAPDQTIPGRDVAHVDPLDIAAHGRGEVGRQNPFGSLFELCRHPDFHSFVVDTSLTRLCESQKKPSAYTKRLW